MWQAEQRHDKKTGFASFPPRFFFLILVVTLLTACKQVEFYAAPLKIPQNHTDVVNSTQTTSSGNFTLINGSTVRVTTFVPSYITAITTFSIQTTGGIAATAEIALMIDNETSDGLQRFLSGTNDRGIGAVLHSKYVTAGTHNVSVLIRRSSGLGVLQVIDVQISAVALP